jgi:hypothetical protein
MAVLTPPKPRSVISDDGGRLRIDIPVVRSLFSFTFLAFWIGGWACGELFAFREVLKSKSIFSNPFLVFWLGMWTVFGVYAIWSWLWLLGGREIIRIENGILSVRKEVGRLGRTNEYSLTDIRALRVSPPVYQSRRNMVPDGTIAFDYGAKTYRLGSGIDEAEAKHLVETIRLRFSIS